MMKKTFLFFSLALIASGAYAQELVTYDYTYGAFTGIEAADCFSVKLVHSTEHAVSITAYSSVRDYVHAYVKDGILRLEVDEKGMPSDLKKEFKKKDSGLSTLNVTVSMSSLRSLTIKGNSVLSSSDTLKTDRFALKLSKTAEVKSLNVEASSSALLELSGNASLNAGIKSQSINIESSGKSKAEIKADAFRTIASAAGFAKIEIFGKSQNLHLSASGNGSAEFNTK